LVPLPYGLSDIAPPIDNFTMQVHYFDGYGGGVNATNAVLASVNNSVIPPPLRKNLTRAGKCRLNAVCALWLA
jgi:superoxide dismutase